MILIMTLLAKKREIGEYIFMKRVSLDFFYRIPKLLRWRFWHNIHLLTSFEGHSLSKNKCCFLIEK